MNFRRTWLALSLLFCSLVAAPAQAHESRPAYLQLHQLDAETYEVLWKVPGISEGRRLALDVQFAPGAKAIGLSRVSTDGNSFVQRWQVRRAGGFDGTAIRIGGLDSTLTDVLVRLERLDGSIRTIRVLPSEPVFVISAAPAGGDVARAYFGLGVEHILRGVDHLMFVLALVMLIGGKRRLFWTITAFTAAHSLTLAAATLGWVHVPTPPVEACIALSIVFVANEILQVRAGRPGLTSRAPWLVAFCFGLLHGFGFAGALAEIGLPDSAIPMALLFFNVGVEFGQVAFVIAALCGIALWQRLVLKPPAWVQWLPAYSIGGVAAFWMLQRIASFPQ